MGILSKLFGTEPQTVENKDILNVYEVELEFNNGETETFEAYNEGDRINEQIYYSTDVKLETEHGYSGTNLVIEGEYDSYNVEVLAREPKVRKIAEETWTIRYESVNGSLKGGTQELEFVDRERVEE